jgi:hypothetical protein
LKPEKRDSLKTIGGFKALEQNIVIHHVEGCGDIEQCK